LAGKRGLSTYANIALVWSKTFYSQAREILSNLPICMHLQCLKGGKEGIQIPVIVVKQMK
jgi:hypothetical protein